MRFSLSATIRRRTDPEARTGNWLAGGSEMPDLVSQALNDYP
jgi:hypothetical protein